MITIINPTSNRFMILTHVVAKLKQCARHDIHRFELFFFKNKLEVDD